jgi:hypothetical protein
MAVTPSENKSSKKDSEDFDISEVHPENKTLTTLEYIGACLLYPFNAMMATKAIDRLRDGQLSSSLLPLVGGICTGLAVTSNFAEKFVMPVINAAASMAGPTVAFFSAIPFVGLVAQTLSLGYSLYQLNKLFNPANSEELKNLTQDEIRAAKIKRGIEIFLTGVLVAVSIGALVNPVTGPIFAGIAGSVLLVKAVLAVIENRNAIFSFFRKLAGNPSSSDDNDAAQDKKVGPKLDSFFKANPLAHSDKHERPPITNSSPNSSFRSSQTSLTSSLADDLAKPKTSPDSTHNSRKPQ